MKHILLLLWLILPILLQAQQGVVSTGGEAEGTGGSMSFSTGQTDFHFYHAETGSIQFGLQQAFFFEDEDPEVPPIRQLTTDDLFQGEDQCFDATQTIVLAGGGETFVVENGTGVDLIAGHNIQMLPGTRVEEGGYLHARITTDGFYCDESDRSILAVNPEGGEAREEEMAIPDRSDSKEDFFTVYPNPTTGDFTVEVTHRDTDAPYVIEIFGMRGEIIMRYDRLMQWQHHLSLQGHQPGIYLIRVQRGDEMGVERIIKR